MELLLAVLIAAYAVRGVGADVAAAVAGKTPPSVLKWEARQKRRARPKKDPGYLGRIWNNALESWADASTRRHNRRMKARDEWEKRKGPEWVEKKLVKLEKAAARRQRFAEKAGVLWGKARDAAANVRERRREDEAWAANARFDAERDDTVPAGLQGSTDLDGSDPAQDEAKVLPFRPRTNDEDDDIVDLDALSESLTNPTPTDQPDHGQDINTGTKEEPAMTNASAISGEITDLASGIELARQMRRYITDLQNTLETLQATMEQTSTGLRQVPASLELASASLQTHGLNGPALEELTVARERTSMVSSALAEAVSALSSVPDHLTIANDSFSRMEGELSSQLGISEQVGAAAARGGVARETDFYLRG